MSGVHGILFFTGKKKENYNRINEGLTHGDIVDLHLTASAFCCAGSSIPSAK